VAVTNFRQPANSATEGNAVIRQVGFGADNDGASDLRGMPRVLEATGERANHGESAKVRSRY